MTVAGVSEGNLEADRVVAEALRKAPSLARHLPRILMPLSGMIDSYSAHVARNPPLFDFFEHVKSSFSDVEYAAIQQNHLSQRNIDFISASHFMSSDLKYLDFPFWAHSKFSVGTKLMLKNYSGQALLDIGAGPAHFGVVAHYFGCQYIGLETVLAPWTPHTKRHLFDDLSEFFRIDRVTNRIRSSGSNCRRSSAWSLVLWGIFARSISVEQAEDRGSGRNGCSFWTIWSQM